MNVEGCLARLDEAITAAEALGLDTSHAIAVRDTGRARLGFPSDAYVLALAGGTGVGKSTLLNAIAGVEVSPASARRPTTAEPVAWVPAGRGRELSSLLTWLGVTKVREHTGDSLTEVAVLDLPDFDSVAREHRERVDALLPRVDAVAWVVDPEKYKDDLVHRSYLRDHAPRIRRQIVVLNRSDLLDRDAVTRVSEDLRAQLRGEGADGIHVVATTARDGFAGIGDLRAWLEAGVEAKRVIAARLGAEARAAATELAVAGGVSDGAPPLIEPRRRDRALDAVARGALAVIDIAGLERQAVAATRLAARPRGAGPFGHLTSAIYRLAGRARASADPAGYLRRWQMRGSLAPTVEPLRELVAATQPSVSAALRPRLAALSTPASIEGRLAGTIDRALTSEAAAFRTPTSAFWSVLGLLQYAVTGVLIFCAIWFGALFLIEQTPVSSVELPVVGALPMPVALLAGALLAGFLLAQLLRLHAGWLGRRWARRIGARVSEEIRGRVRDSLLLPIEQLDASRAALAAAARGMEGCGRD